MHNAIEGGKRTSKHLLGKAFDFDQLSSEANWDVAKTAYQCFPNYEILLYYYKNGKRYVVEFSEVSDENQKPWDSYNFEHGHFGI